MSYDFAIWKRSSATKTAELAGAYEALCEERAHPAVASFDVEELTAAIEAVCGSQQAEDATFALEGDSREGSSWLIMNCSFAEATSLRDKVLGLVLSRGLMLYDPQRQVVWGNRRPAKN